MFAPRTLKEGIESVVGCCNGLSGTDRMRLETPLFANAILRSLPPGAKEILDYGCGFGRLAKEILARSEDPTLTILGADTSPEELNLAVQYVASPRFTACRPSEVNRKFRAIYCIYVLQHVPARELDATIRFLHEHLTDDGVLIYCSSEGRMAVRADGRGFENDGVNVRQELSRCFEPLGNLFSPTEMADNEILRKMINGEGGCLPHPALVYRRHRTSGAADAGPENTSLVLTPDERGLVEEMDQQIAQIQMQRAGVLNLSLRTRKIREGQWDCRNGNLIRMDAVPQPRPPEPMPTMQAPVPPPDTGMLIQRALAEREANHAESVIELASRAIAEGDRSMSPYVLKACSLGDLCRYDESKAVCEEALKLCPPGERNGILNERGFQRLLSGDFGGGWPDWDRREQRQKIGANITKVWPRMKEWDGSPDQWVLLCAEKGLGDTILFLRYLSVLQAQNCKIQFLASCDSVPLVPIMREYPGIIGSYGGEDSLPAMSESWICLESLPRIAKDPNTIPAPFEFPLTWKQPNREGRKLRVGLCWHGHSKVISASKFRRCEDLKLWEMLTAIGNVEFISLQQGEQGPCASSPLPADGTLLHTLETICSCDLVISTDTSIVHMAASLGCPTWMPMHRLNYWPWIKDGEEKTPWYPSLKIFRQSDKGGWRLVFEKICTAAGQLLDQQAVQCVPKPPEAKAPEKKP
jgi:SAM-dependent methyltransferase